MSLKKVTTNITYRVPTWNYCNMIKPGTLSKPTNEKCRFCVKDGKGYRCALYNSTLDVKDTVLVRKTRDCEKATVGYKSIVEDVPDVDPTPTIEPKKLMKTTIQLYNKTRKQLLSQGYPAALADQVAMDFVLEK